MKGLLIDWLRRVKSPHLESVRERMADKSESVGLLERDNSPKK